MSDKGARRVRGLRRFLLWGAVVLSVIGLLPLLFITALQLWVIFTVPGQIAEIEAQLERDAGKQGSAGEMAALVAPAPAAAPPEPAAPARSLVAPNGQPLNDRDRRLVSSPESFGKGRSVHVDFSLLPAALADPGEPVPDGVLREVFIEARAAGLAESLCADVIATLGRKCIVEDVRTGRPVNDAESRQNGMFDLTIELAFVPLDPVGGSFETPLVVVDEHRPTLFRTRPGHLSLPVQRAAVVLALAGARDECARLRARHGGCTIKRVIASHVSRAPAGMRARAELLVLRRPAPDELSAQ